MEGIVALSAGTNHTLAIYSDGSLFAWGSNFYGQLGISSSDSRLKHDDSGWPYIDTPTKIMDDVIAVSAGSNHSLAITSDGSLWTWGESHYIPSDIETFDQYIVIETPLKIMDDVVAISAGERWTSFAVKSDGSLWAWGCHSAGQLGVGAENSELKYIPLESGVDYIFSNSPIKVMDDVVAVSARGRHTLAIKTDGSLWAWGSNAYGQLGIGEDHSELKYNDHRDPHDGTVRREFYTDIPIKVMDNVAEITAGNHCSFAIKTDGSLWAWGPNESGQLGLGEQDIELKTTGNDFYTTSYIDVPTKVMDEVSTISAGYTHVLAVKSDGSLWAWGDNASGQFGLGQLYREYNDVPVKVMDGVDIVDTGFQYSLAVKNDGSLWAWGYNYEGQLGTGNNDGSDTPVEVLFER